MCIPILDLPYSSCVTLRTLSDLSKLLFAKNNKSLSLRFVLRVTSMKVANMAIDTQQVLGVISLESLASLHLPLCYSSINMGLLVGLQSGAAHSIKQHIPLSIICLCSIPSSNCLDLKEESQTAWRKLRDYTVFPLVFIDEQIWSQIKKETSSISLTIIPQPCFSVTTYEMRGTLCEMQSVLCDLGKFSGTDQRICRSSFGRKQPISDHPSVFIKFPSSTNQY